MLLALLKEKTNEVCHDHIFKCLHVLIEKQDEIAYSNEKESEKFQRKRMVKPETFDLLINHLMGKKLRFNEKNDQNNEIFQILMSFCQESNHFELFSINLLEKLAVTMNKELKMILDDLYTYKQQIGFEKITGVDKKNDHENVFLFQLFKKKKVLF